MNLRVLDLFSGIGGFSLGLERTGGFKTVAFCEIDPFCRKVLAKHWPEVPCYEDVRELTAEKLRADGIVPDVICGGFPCQDISHSNPFAEGIGGKRSGLWREYARLIGELRPQFVFVENVGALTFRGLEQVTADFATLGYDAEWDIVSASRVGAPHARERLWLVAYPDGAGLSGLEPARSALRSQPRQTPAEFGNEIIPCGAEWPLLGSYLRVGDGLPRPVDEIRALGNAVVPQIPELIGRAILAAEA
jgi:DNA (cytosine-5)-methyltransferase 1